MPAVFLGGFYAAVASAVAATVAGQSLVIPVRDAAIAVGLGVVSVGLGLILYTLGSRRVPAAESTLLSMTEVVLAPIWVWLLFGETAGSPMLIGGTILMSALAGNAIIGVVRERRASRARESAPRHAGPGTGHAAAARPQARAGLAPVPAAGYRALSSAPDARGYRR
jgi:hypothetical protein